MARVEMGGRGRSKKIGPGIPKPALETIVNCDAGLIGNKITVNGNDLSQTIGGEPDNDYHCPVTLMFVPLVRNGSKIVCREVNCNFNTDDLLG